jgi:hypothetical protein
MEIIPSTVFLVRTISKETSTTATVFEQNSVAMTHTVGDMGYELSYHVSLSPYNARNFKVLLEVSHNKTHISATGDLIEILSFLR